MQSPLNDRNASIQRFNAIFIGYHYFTFVWKQPKFLSKNLSRFTSINCSLSRFPAIKGTSLHNQLTQAHLIVSVKPTMVKWPFSRRMTMPLVETLSLDISIFPFPFLNFLLLFFSQILCVWLENRLSHIFVFTCNFDGVIVFVIASY